MKNKCINFIAVALQHKKTVITIPIVFIAVIIFFNVVVGGKPKKYEHKIRLFAESQYSEGSMKQLLKDKVIDLKGAVAWQKANHNPEEFKKEYNKVKNNTGTEELERAILEYAKESENYDTENVSNIGKPKKNKKYGKIYTVFAKLDTEECYFIFYKNKIIDVMIDNGELSYFEYMLDLYDN